jgi:hypothetical protein
VRVCVLDVELGVRMWVWCVDARVDVCGCGACRWWRVLFP